MSEQEYFDLTIARIKELQDESGLSSRQFAKKIGINVATFNRWKNGFIKTLKTETISVIAKEFNVSALWLCGFNVPKEQETEEHKSIRNKISDNLFFLSNKELHVVNDLIESFLKNKEK